MEYRSGRVCMPFVVLLIVGLVAGAAVYGAARSRLWATREPLVLAVGGAVIGVLVLGLLAYLMRSSGRVVAFDLAVARWAATHARQWSTALIELVTALASVPIIVGVIVTVSIAEMWRRRDRWVAPFLVTAVVGEAVFVAAMKQLFDRARPTFAPLTEAMGPSFPSGHSATAAALYAGVALVLGSGRSSRARALLAGAAAGVAVGVAGSRVMLDVHWFSDVVAGLAFGWAWFALCAACFGGRVLRGEEGAVKVMH